jgi:hypothetical protein
MCVPHYDLHGQAFLSTMDACNGSILSPVSYSRTQMCLCWQGRAKGSAKKQRDAGAALARGLPVGTLLDNPAGGAVSQSGKISAVAAFPGDRRRAVARGKRVTPGPSTATATVTTTAATVASGGASRGKPAKELSKPKTAIPADEMWQSSSEDFDDDDEDDEPPWTLDSFH